MCGYCTEILLIKGNIERIHKIDEGHAMLYLFIYGRSELDHFMYQGIQLYYSLHYNGKKQHFLDFLLTCFLIVHPLLNRSLSR